MDYNTYDYQNHKPSHLECTAAVKKTHPYDAKKTKESAFNAMDQLTGWCTKFKAATLIDIILEKNCKTIVEIGVWGGRSLVPMACAVKELGYGTVYGIDPWSASASVEGMDGVNKDWWGAIDHELIYQDLAQKIILFNLENYVKLIKSSSVAASPIDNIDLLHIDGNHSEEASLYDVMKWAPLVKSGGFIVFDDVSWGTTNKAVAWLDEHYQRVANYHEDCIWSIWVKE